MGEGVAMPLSLRVVANLGMPCAFLLHPGIKPAFPVERPAWAPGARVRM